MIRLSAASGWPSLAWRLVAGLTFVLEVPAPASQSFIELKAEGYRLKAEG
jgi:hypothetical protein